MGYYVAQIDEPDDIKLVRQIMTGSNDQRWRSHPNPLRGKDTDYIKAKASQLTITFFLSGNDWEQIRLGHRRFQF